MLIAQYIFSSTLGNLSSKNFISPDEFVLGTAAFSIVQKNGILSPWQMKAESSESGIVLRGINQYSALYFIFGNSLFYNSPLAPVSLPKQGLEAHLRENGISYVRRIAGISILSNTKIITGNLINYNQKKYSYGIGYAIDASVLTTFHNFRFGYFLQNVLSKMYWAHFADDKFQRKNIISAGFTIGNKNILSLSAGHILQKGADYNLGFLLKLDTLSLVFGTNRNFANYRFGIDFSYADFKISIATSNNFQQWITLIAYFI